MVSPILKLTIQVFDHPAEEAEVLPTLVPAELIGAILAEFRDELPFLSDRPADYALRRAAGEVLTDGVPLGRQAITDPRLELIERHGEPPPGTRPAPAAYYLREPVSGRVFALRWLPAIIGRSDPKLSDEALLAVSLSGFPSAERVSRRHARIVEQGGQLVLECLANNPIVLRSAGREVPLVAGRRHPLKPDDVILLEYSQIQLQVLRRGST